MKIVHRIGVIPDGAARRDTTVQVRKVSDGSSLTTLISDADGFVEWERDGHPEPYYLYVTGVPGGDKYLDSREAKTAGVIALKELPAILRAMGDGVTRGYGNDFALSLVGGGLTVSVATGAANVAGHPVVTYSTTNFPLTRPVSGTRTDRVIIRLYPEGSATTPGKADLAILTGVLDAGAPALTQTSTVHEISLGQIAVPSAGTLIITDERVFSNERTSDADVARTSSFTTTSGSGVVVGDSIILDTPDPLKTYSVQGWLTAQQLETQVVTTWVLQDTYGPTFDALVLQGPQQIAIDSTGRILIADNITDRLVVLNADATYQTHRSSLTGITGVCVDSSNNIYVALPSSIKKYNSALSLQWTQPSDGILVHCATDGTHLYVTDRGLDKVRKFLCSTGAFVTTWGSAGSGNGQFTTPWGIACRNTGFNVFVWVVDAGNTRVQRFNGGTGVYIDQFAVGSAPRGAALTGPLGLWVAESGMDRVSFYEDVASGTASYVESFTQNDPSGVALATGDIVWVSNTTESTIAKWDESATPGGHGSIAIEIDGVVSDYVGIGSRDGAVSNAASGSKAGGSTVLVRAFAKATASTLTLKGLVLSARAVPQR